MLAMLPPYQGSVPVTPTLVVDGFVVGAKRAGTWSPVEFRTGWAKRPAMTFRAIRIGGVRGSVKSAFVDEEVPQGVYLKRNSDGPSVLVGGVTPRIPRVAKSISMASEVYRRTLLAFLDANGLPKATVRITKLTQVDLDGDGTREVLIEARNRDDVGLRSLTETFGPNDYSFVLLRAIRGGKVVDIPLGYAGGRKGDGLLRKLRAIADVDGDGRMEIVLSYTAWEAFGGSMWSYRAGVAKLLLEGGSGV